MRKQHQLVGEFREDSFKHLVLINAASWTALFDLIRYFVSNPIVTTIVIVMKMCHALSVLATKRAQWVMFTIPKMNCEVGGMQV